MLYTITTMTCDVSWYQSVAQTRLTRIPAVQRVQRDVPEVSQPRMHCAPCFASHHPRPHTLHQLRTGTPLECPQTPLPYAMRINQRCRRLRYWIRTCRATEIANYNARSHVLVSLYGGSRVRCGNTPFSARSHSVSQPCT
mgnify:CR=1 FL=1